MEIEIHVGKTPKYNPRTKKNEKCTYQDVTYDADKWADAKKYLPIDFDLCYLKTATITVPGWHCTNTWDGNRVTPDMDILYWKLKSSS